MIQKIRSVLFFSLASIFLAFPQQNTNPDTQNPAFQQIERRLSNYTERIAPEKIYLQTDKDFYTNGETIWFNTYLLDAATHLPSKKSQVVYVELLDDKDHVFAQRTLFVNLFAAAGDIQITEDLPEGPYRLRAYTKYMLNDNMPTYFEKTVTIWVQKINSLVSSSVNRTGLKSKPKDIKENEIIQPAPEEAPKKINFRFFPEGGDLITGLESAIGLKVTDGTGNDIMLEGKIEDRNGNMIAPFRTHKFGLGMTRLTPLPDMDYRATVIYQGKKLAYPLPQPLRSGYGLQIRNQGDHLLIMIATNKDEGLKGTLLVGHLRGKPILKKMIVEDDKNTVSYKLLTNTMDNGVAHFTLFAPNGEPFCERLVFIDNPKNDIKLAIAQNGNSFGRRERAAVSLALNDEQGNTIGGSFSVSVAAENAFDPLAPDIKSWLLLNADLGGTLENPSYFFEEDSYARKYLLDILMLTHGWRRFVWKDLLNQKVSPPIRYPPEKGLMITGKTTAFNNQYQPKKTMTTLSILGNDILQQRKATNFQGKYSYGPFYFQDSVDAIIKAVDIEPGKIKKSEFAIHIDEPTPRIRFPDSIRRNRTSNTIEVPQEFLETSYQQKIADFRYDPKVTRLEEVEVKAKKKTQEQLIEEELNERTLYGQAYNRLITDSLPGLEAASALDILRYTPGVRVFGNYPDQSVVIRGVATFMGGTSPLFLIDGFPVGAEIVQQMLASEVMFIDILKGPEAAIYGVRGGNGVVAIYTRRALNATLERENYPNITNFKVPGFYKAREFYSPDYDRPIVSQKPDYRTTLYWNPDISINETGKSSVEFFTGDSPGRYRVIVEGISNDGRPVRGAHTFQIAEDY